MSVSSRNTASGTGASGPTIPATSQPGSSTLAASQDLPPAAKVQRWIVAIAVMSSAVLEVLDTSVVNVSLPHIAGSLSSTVEEATWVLTSYIVANAIILPVTGWLANYMGRKRLLMTVVTGFTVSSILCGMAPNLPMLIFFRVLQGTTGGGLQPLSQAVLLEEFPGRERGKAMAYWGMGIVAAPVLGPTIGGWITDSYSWRWVFYINVPVGILSLILIYLFVRDPHYIRRGTLRADFWGLGMLALGMGALQIMLDKGQEKDWFGSEMIRVLAVMAVVFLTAFVIRELTVKGPHRPLSFAAFQVVCHRHWSGGSTRICALWRTHPVAALHADPAGLDGGHGGPLDQSPGNWNGPLHAAGRLSAGQGLGWATHAGNWICRRRPVLLRLRAYDAAIRHMGHLLDPNHARRCTGTAVCAPYHPDHGLHSASGDGLCH